MRNVSILILFFFGTSYLAFSQGNTIKDSCLVIPTVLVKNNDQKLEIISKCELSEFNFQLFNRWGQLMYEASTFMYPFDLDINEKIDKNKNVSKYNEGTYFYKITFRKYNGLEERNLTGFLTIM